MNDLIKITQTQIGAENINSVDAKTIYEFLEIKTAYTTWIQRVIEKYDFIENQDFISNLKESNGGRPSKDFIVSMDMAKELCLIENNPKGKETRKYFIQAEKQSQKVLTTSEQIALIAQGHQEIDQRLATLEATKRLENWQEKSLKDAVSKKAYEIADDKKNFKAYVSKLHRNIWSLFKKKFFLPRYNELPGVKYQEGLDFIDSLTIADMV